VAAADRGPWDAADGATVSGPVPTAVPAARPPSSPRETLSPPPDRGDALAAFAREVSDCTRCRLAQGRTQVVFGVGDPQADVMLVGEAPGFHEDQQGYPFVGQAGKLLDRLLAGIGLERRDVYIANVLKCRPPGNRDPQPDEIEACERHLFRQIELIEPTLVATLGNFATKLLSGSRTGSRASTARRRRRRSAAGASRSTRSTTRPPRSTRPRCCGRSRRTSRGYPRSSRAPGRRRPPSSGSRFAPTRRSRPRPVPAAEQLGLF
jgi:DNA polymerase